MESQQIYDSALLGILQSHGEIHSFLDTIFGFLYRRTDFFRTQCGDNKIGFPPKVAERLVQSMFVKYDKLTKEFESKHQKAPTTKSDKDIPVAKNVEVETTTESQPKPIDVDKTENANEIVNNPDNQQNVQDDEEVEDEETKKCKKEQKVYQSLSESYNGAIRENYSWSQTIHELDVLVTVPKHVTKGKQVKVDIEHTHLTVKAVDDEGKMKVIVDGDLCWKVNVEKSYWTLVPGQVQINLEKVQERWWDGVLTDEPKINVRNIDASRPMDELGEDEQAKIHELMYNEQQKRLGKPTVEQMKIQSILKEAWDTEGSPFKGQPFDLSKINLSSDSTGFAQQ